MSKLTKQELKKLDQLEKDIAESLNNYREEKINNFDIIEVEKTHGTSMDMGAVTPSPKPEPDRWWVTCDKNEPRHQSFSVWRGLEPEFRKDSWHSTHSETLWIYEENIESLLKHLGVTIPEPGQCIEIPPPKGDALIEKIGKQETTINRLDEERMWLNQEVNKLKSEVEFKSMVCRDMDKNRIEANREIEKLRAHAEKMHQEKVELQKTNHDQVHTVYNGKEISIDALLRQTRQFEDEIGNVADELQKTAHEKDRLYSDNQALMAKMFGAKPDAPAHAFYTIEEVIKIRKPLDREIYDLKTENHTIKSYAYSKECRDPKHKHFDQALEARDQDVSRLANAADFHEQVGKKPLHGIRAKKPNYRGI